MDPVICLITSGGLQRAAWPAFLDRARAAAGAGVHIIQIREPALDAGSLFELTRLSVDVLQRTRVRVVINDRLDIALAAGAHGVHLRGASMPSLRARSLAPRGFLVGRSIRSAEEARLAELQGVLDYLVFGTVFSTASKPGVHTAGTSALAEIVRTTTIPVVAVGGMTANRLAGVGSAGAAGFAAISLFDAPPVGQLGSIVRDARVSFSAAD